MCCTQLSSHDCVLIHFLIDTIIQETMDKLAELAGPELGPNFYELWKVSSRVISDNILAEFSKKLFAEIKQAL